MTTNNLRIVTLLLALTTSFTSFAQKSKLQTAIQYAKYDEFDKAKQAIDECIAHVQTMNLAKTWFYRGVIYQNIYSNEKFKSLSDNALMIALESYNKVEEIDPKSDHQEDILRNKQVMANQMFDLGVKNFNDKEFNKALQSFETVLSLAPADTQAVLNCAYSADKAEANSKAIIYYNRLIEMKYNDPKIYLFLAGIHKKEGSSQEAMKTIQEGRDRFPDSNELLIEELNSYLVAGDNEKAEVALNQAIASDSKNPTLYFAQGTILDKMKKKEQAAIAYKKAIELKPDYFDAYYNLGAMYFNEAAEMANDANKIPPREFEKYKAAETKFKAKFNEAAPFLEKALELNPTDDSTIQSLKQLYARTGDTEKYNKLNK